jgi:protein TonB
MRRSSTIVSIVVHAVVVVAALLAQVLAVGPLPAVPNQRLDFAGLIPVRVVDIPLPAPQRSAGGVAAAEPGDPAIAPVDAPPSVVPEIASGCRCVLPDTVGMERGIGSWTDFGTVAPVPVPPPPTAPQTPIHLHSGMQAPRKITHVDPVYPRAAQIAHVEGTVILEAVIDVNGAVTSVRVLRSITLLDQAALDAVRGWKFTPTLLNGVAVPVALTITVRFSLTQ